MAIRSCITGSYGLFWYNVDNNISKRCWSQDSDPSLKESFSQRHLLLFCSLTFSYGARMLPHGALSQLNSTSQISSASQILCGVYLRRPELTCWNTQWIFLQCSNLCVEWMSAGKLEDMLIRSDAPRLKHSSGHATMVWGFHWDAKCLVNRCKSGLHGIPEWTITQFEIRCVETHHFAQFTFRDQGFFQAVAEVQWGLVLGREDLQQSNLPHVASKPHTLL